MKREAFEISMEDHPTRIRVEKREGDSFLVEIITIRPDLAEPLATSMFLSPKTVNLLSHALTRACHDPTVWFEYETNQSGATIADNEKQGETK